MHLESNTHADIAQFQAAIESHAASLGRLEKQVSREATKASLSPDRLSQIRGRITALHTELEQLMKVESSPLQRQIDSKSAKLQSLQFKFLRPSVVAALKGEITSLQASQAKVQNKLMIMSETASRLIQDAGRLHLKAQERLISQVLCVPSGDLKALQASIPDVQKQEVIQHYRSLLAKEGGHLSHEVKTVILKTIIAAQILENPLISFQANDKVQTYLVDKSLGADVVHPAKFLGQGADAKAYLIAKQVFKFAHPLTENPSSLENLLKDIMVLTHLTTGKGANPESPGYRCIEEFHGAKVLGREQCMLVKYYENGSLQKQVNLQLFSSMLGLKDEDFKAPNKQELIEEAIKAHIGTPAFKEVLSCLTTRANDSGQSAVTEDEVLQQLSGELKTHFVPFDFKERWQMVLQVVAGAEYMIDAGVLHGDIKPANIRWEKGRFVHGDFGQSSFMKDLEKRAQVACKFGLEPATDLIVGGDPPNDTKPYSPKAQFSSLKSAFDSIPLATSTGAEHHITRFDDYMDRLSQAGIASLKEDGKYAIHPYQADLANVIMSTICANKLTKANVEKYQDFLARLESAGFIKKNGDTYSMNINVADDVKADITATFNFLIAPCRTLIGQKEYASERDEERLDSAVWEGKTPGEIKQIIESINTFSVGVTIIEALTGKRPDKNQSGRSITGTQWTAIKKDIKALGFSDKFCKILYKMVRDQGMPASALETKLFSTNRKLSPERKESLEAEFKKFKRGEITLEQSVILTKEVQELEIKKRDLVYKPRKPLSDCLQTYLLNAKLPAWIQQLFCHLHYKAMGKFELKVRIFLV